MNKDELDGPVMKKLMVYGARILIPVQCFQLFNHSIIDIQVYRDSRTT